MGRVPVRRSADNLWNVLSSTMVYRDCARVRRFGSKCPYPPGHPSVAPDRNTYNYTFTVSCTVHTSCVFAITWSTFSYLLWLDPCVITAGLFPSNDLAFPHVLLLLLWFEGIFCRIPILVDLGRGK